MSKQIIAGAVASLWLALGASSAFAADPLSQTKTVYGVPDDYGRVAETTVTVIAERSPATDTTNEQYNRHVTTTHKSYAAVDGTTIWSRHHEVICEEVTSSLDHVTVKVDQVDTSKTTDEATNLSSETRRHARRYTTDGLLQYDIAHPTTAEGCQSNGVTAPASRLITKYSYKAFGPVEAQTIVSGLRLTNVPYTAVSYDYDALGIYAQTTTNALGHSASVVQDVGTGRISSQTDRNDLQISYKYDSQGRVTQETHPDGAQVSYSYTACSGAACHAHALHGAYKVTRTEVHVATKTVNGTPTTTTTSVAPTTETIYDALDRPILTREEVPTLGQATSAWRVTQRVEYNARGLIAKQAEPYVDETVDEKAPTVSWVSFGYDRLGRLQTRSRTVNGTSVSETTSYSGLSTTVTNDIGQKRSSRVGVLGKPLAVTDPTNVTLAHSYDALGNLKRSVRNDAASAGLARVYEYDEAGNKISDHDPDLGTWTYLYDGLNQLKTQTDVKGRVTQFEYDRLGRSLKRSEPDLTSEWVYDTAPGKGKGQLHKATTGAAPNVDYVRAYAYDELGRETSVTSTIDGQDYVFGTGYDSAGRPSTVRYPNLVGGYRQVYDATGFPYQVQDIDNAAVTYWQALALNDRGQITQEQFGNGLVTERQYVADSGDLETVKTGPLSAGQVSASIQNDRYAFDALGNLKNRTNSLNGLSESFTYDALNRVTDVVYAGGAVNGQKEKFSYDANGNLLFKSGLGWLSYQATTPSGRALPHAVSSVDPRGLNADTGLATSSTWVLISNSGISFPIPVYPRNYLAGGKDPLSYSYDDLGNMLSGDGRTIAWTSFNLPSRLTRNGQSTDFIYNGEHERVKKTGNGCSTLYFNPRIDLGGRFEQETCGSKQTARWTLYADEAKGEYVTVTENGTVNASQSGMWYFHTDHLGSVAATTNTAGQVARMSYDVWGQRRNVDGTPLAATPVLPTNRGFTEHEMLDDLGLVHMNARLYDPKLGRFISADPTLAYENDWQDYNIYSYVHNNPLSMVDPSGYAPDSYMQMNIGSMWVRDNSGQRFQIPTYDYTLVQNTTPTYLEQRLSQTAGNNSQAMSGWGVGRVPQPAGAVSGGSNFGYGSSSQASNGGGRSSAGGGQASTSSALNVVVVPTREAQYEGLSFSEQLAVYNQIRAGRTTSEKLIYGVLGDPDSPFVEAGVSSPRQAISAVVSRLAVNAQRGRLFERQVLDALDVMKNGMKVEGRTASGKLGRAIPDAIRAAFVEVKNVRSLSYTKQLQIQVSAALREGVPLNLIVSPRTMSISQPLLRAVEQTGGSIRVFDPVTKMFGAF